MTLCNVTVSILQALGGDALRGTICNRVYREVCDIGGTVKPAEEKLGVPSFLTVCCQFTRLGKVTVEGDLYRQSEATGGSRFSRPSIPPARPPGCLTEGE